MESNTNERELYNKSPYPHDLGMNINNENIKKSAGRGALFQISSGGIQTFIRIGASMILARILAPSDFGLFGMALLLSELVLRIGALGMGVGIIAKRNVTENELSTAFWTMASIRVVLFSFTFFFAPFLSSFFNEARLIPVIQAVSFTFLFQILGIIGNTLLKKRLLFYQIFIINITSSIFESGFAIFLVLIYVKNYWALVIAMVASRFLNNFMVFIFSKWKPTFTFNKDSFVFLFRYGINSLGSSLTEYFNSNVDYLIIGKILGPKILGYYEFAYRIPFLIENRISYPLREIMFPTLAVLNDSDEKLAAGSIKGIKYIALICFPCLGGMAVVADLMVRVLWGEQWLPIVVPLQILCFAAAIKCVGNPIRDVFNCKNRPDVPFKFSIISLIFTIIVVSTLGFYFGILGVAWAMMISTIPTFFLFVFAFKLIDASFPALLREIFPIIISTSITIIIAYFVKYYLKMTNLPTPAILILSIFFGVLAYWGSLKFGFKSIYLEIIELIIDVLGLKRKNKAKLFNETNGSIV